MMVEEKEDGFVLQGESNYTVQHFKIRMKWSVLRRENETAPEGKWNFPKGT
jgi:hypothetical protein